MQQDGQRRLVGVREAARLLGEMGQPISASTISRQIGSLYVNHGTPERPLVDLDQVIEARRNRLDPDRQIAGLKARGMLPLEAPGPQLEEEQIAQVTTRVVSTDGELGRARLRKAAADADMAEMDLLERQRELAPARDFEDGGFELGQLVRQAHQDRVPALLAAMKEHAGNDRALTAAIERLDRDVEEGLAHKVEALLNGKEEGPS